MVLSPLVSRSALVALCLYAGVLVTWASSLARDENPVDVASRQRPPPPPPAMALAVDARDLPRGMLRATVTWPVAPGRQWLRFPRWIQGTHAPCGLVENLVGLVISDDRGTVLPWTRDPLDTHRFAVTVGPGATGISVALVYLANQPSINSQPVDVLARSGVATINWNNALLHPERWSDTDLRVAATLRLPAGWRQACALEAQPAAEGVVAFAATDLRTLIDSPVLCGRELSVHDLAVDRFAPHRIAVAAPQSTGDPPQRALDQLRALAAEARELWGTAPCDRYTWLLALGRETPRYGLEHLASSANGLSQDSWFDGAGLESGAAFLLAHEYGHVWIGKHHRPAGMLTPDCHTGLDTRLLWVYEGFDQYLGMILAARSGAVDRTAWMERMTSYVEQAVSNRSRWWRPLEDAAASSHLLRGRRGEWSGLRGGQDYYVEGMLLCLEADGLIRRASGGTRSFDDVLSRLFATGPVGAVLPFTEEDVFSVLAAVEPSVDWPALVARRVRSTASEPDLAALSTWGMRAAWDGQRPDEEMVQGYLDERWSAGLLLWRGRVTDVVPGSAADRAGIPLGAVIRSLDDAPFTPTAWDRRLHSDERSPLRLRFYAEGIGEAAVELAMPCAPRYLRIEPGEQPADRAILDAILAPRSPEGRAVRAAGQW